MTSISPQYITDESGKKLSVILSIEEYKALLEELEELEDVRLFDEGKKEKGVSLPLDEAFTWIENRRK